MQNEKPIDNAPAPNANDQQATDEVQPQVNQAASIGPALNPNTQAANTQQYLVGSQLEKKREPAPKGIYIIAGLIFLGFAISFFDTSQNSMIYTIAMFLDLILGIGLLLRLEVARKVMVWLSGTIVVLSVILVFGFINLQNKLSVLKQNYETAVQKIDKSNLTDSQRQTLDNMNKLISEKEKQVGKLFVFTYIKYGVTIVEMTAIIVYLTRGPIKAVFKELEK